MKIIIQVDVNDSRRPIIPFTGHHGDEDSQLQGHRG